MRALLLALGCLWLRTLRVRWTGSGPESLPARAVIVLWHEHLPACIRAFSHLGIDVLISPSADGEWAAEACRRFGYRVHRGSSTRGAFGGMRTVARGLETGSRWVGMALDGPRGPRRCVKPGSLWLASLADVPVLPVWVRAPFSFRLGTWDRCLVPMPFSKVEVSMGQPISPENPGELASAMASLERSGRSRA